MTSYCETAMSRRFDAILVSYLSLQCDHIHKYFSAASGSPSDWSLRGDALKHTALPARWYDGQ